jgi:hypothetical protein
VARLAWVMPIKRGDQQRNSRKFTSRMELHPVVWL